MSAVDTDDLDDAAAKTRKAGLEGLPDGKYEFQVTKAELKDLRGKPGILAREAVVFGGEHDGHTVKWDVFLRDKDGNPKEQALSQVRKELTALGFDEENWTAAAGRPFTAELRKACVAMAGLRFLGTKKANESGGKVYQNLHVNERSGTDGRPAKLGAAEIAQAVGAEIPF
jgi:hypothetical protein